MMRRHPPHASQLSTIRCRQADHVGESGANHRQSRPRAIWLIVASFLDGVAKFAALSSSISEREWCAALSGKSFPKCVALNSCHPAVGPIATTIPYEFHKPILPASEAEVGLL
jgi:hypothetical protein